MQYCSIFLAIVTAVLHFPLFAQPTSHSQSITVFAAGDIADCSANPPDSTKAYLTGKMLAGLLENDPHSRVITLGDNVYKDGTLQEFKTCYEQTWGSFKNRTYPSPGNHEYHTHFGQDYFEYFKDSAVQNTTGYYSFNLNEWHIISLNSNLKPAEHLKQLSWLENDLRDNAGRCSFAFWHHPVFSSGEHGNNEQMLDIFTLLYKAKVALVLNGHDHNFERFDKVDSKGNLDSSNGVVEIVVGTGGARLRPLSTLKPNSLVFDSKSYGVLKLVLKSKQIDFEFLPIAGDFRDTGVINCPH
jgi:acid phosphatase type 7